MKKIFDNMCYILESSLNLKILAWFCGFLGLNIIAQLVTIINVSPAILQGCNYALFLLDILLIIGFIGFLFLSSVGAKESKEKPLAPLFSKALFTQGVNVIFTLVVTAIPLFVLCGAIKFTGYQEGYLFLREFILLYVIFGLFPTYMQMVQEYPNYSLKNSRWAFFKKNASAIFACVFWCGVLLVSWSFLTEYILILAQKNSKSVLELAIYILIPYFFLSYVIVVASLIAGVLVRQKAVLVIEENMQEPVVEKTVDIKPKEKALKKTKKNLKSPKHPRK